jgi:hypothetical protein
MRDTSTDPFTDDVVAAIMSHMNDDHAADSLVIVRAFGDQPLATSVTMTGMDADGIDFDAVVGDDTVAVRIPWAEQLTERAQVRTEVVRLHGEACAALGIEPDATEAH